MYPTSFPYAKPHNRIHFLTRPFFNTILKFSFLIRLGLLTSFLKIPKRTICALIFCMAWSVYNNRTMNFNCKNRKLKPVRHLEQWRYRAVVSILVSVTRLTYLTCLEKWHKRKRKRMRRYCYKMWEITWLESKL